MSEPQARVTTIENIRKHPNADKLDIADVLGWQVVVKRDEYIEGQKIVYFPPDTILPGFVSDTFGVTNYLSKGRVHQARLRQEPSFGLVMPLPHNHDWPEGTDISKYYMATKYEPPVRIVCGDATKEHPLFERYTKIKNMRNYPDIFTKGENVIITEKIHGTNCRVGIINGEPMCGSHRVSRKKPEKDTNGDKYTSGTYWYPMSIPGVKKMLEDISQEHAQVILFGEIYGNGIQSMKYGCTNDFKFAAFDLLIDGEYVNYEKFFDLCTQYEVPTVPFMTPEPFSLEHIKKISEGKTSLNDNHIREGVVVRPVESREHPKIGRVVLKYVSDSYLFGKHSDYKEE